jgi:hypothetical protein
MDIAELLDITTRMVIKMIAAGKFDQPSKPFKVGAVWKVPGESVVTYLRGIGYPEDKLPAK